MTTQRLVRREEAHEVPIDTTVVREYFAQVVSDLGLATATMNGTYPPEGKGTWAVNQRVEEIYYVLEGTAVVIYQDGERVHLEPGCAVYLPRGVKYRVEEARKLNVVVSTSPAWSPEQHVWSDE